MPTRKRAGKSAARATSKDKGQVGSERAVATTVSGPSHATESLTELTPRRAHHRYPFATEDQGGSRDALVCAWRTGIRCSLSCLGVAARSTIWRAHCWRPVMITAP
jgi:hypothetical protein